jgi:hypothetical protein
LVILFPPRNRSGIYNLSSKFRQLQAFDYLQMQLSRFLKKSQRTILL